MSAFIRVPVRARSWEEGHRVSSNAVNFLFDQFAFAQISRESLASANITTTPAPITNFDTINPTPLGVISDLSDGSLTVIGSTDNETTGAKYGCYQSIVSVTTEATGGSGFIFLRLYEDGAPLGNEHSIELKGGGSTQSDTLSLPEIFITNGNKKLQLYTYTKSGNLTLDSSHLNWSITKVGMHPDA